MSDTSTIDASPPSTSGRSPRRRWLLVGAAVAALAVIVALVVVLAGGHDEPVATSDQTATTVEPRTTTTEATTTTIDEATSTTAVPTTEPTPAVIGDIVARGDLDGDGSDELFTRAPMGASTEGIRVYTIGEDGGALAVTLDGTPAVFPVGASVRNLTGPRCDAPTHTLRAYAGASHDGETFTVIWHDLRLDDGVLTEVGNGHGTAHTGDELHVAASTFDTTHLGAGTHHTEEPHRDHG